MKTLKIAFLLYACLFFYGKPAQAQSCGSLTSIVSDIWKDHSSILKQLGCGTAAVATSSPEVYFSCLEKANQVDDYVQKMVKAFNGNKDRWSTIGPRVLEFGKTDQGTIQSTFGRVYVTPHGSTSDKVTITVEEMDGKGKVAMVVCKYNEKGKATSLETRWFNDTDADKKDGREKKEITISGVKGDIITVHLDGKSATNSFQYKLKCVNK